MTKNDIIEELYRDGTFNKVTEKYSLEVNLKEDFKMELITILLEYDEDKIIELYNKKQLNYFIIRIAVNNYKSTTSP